MRTYANVFAILIFDILHCQEKIIKETMFSGQNLNLKVKLQKFL